MFPPPPLAILWNYNDQSCRLESLTSLGAHGSRCCGVPCDSEWDHSGTEGSHIPASRTGVLGFSCFSTSPCQAKPPLHCTPTAAALLSPQWPRLPLKLTDT